MAHSLLTTIYHMLRTGTVYTDLGTDYFDQRSPKQHARYHLRRLAELGYQVTVAPVDAA